MNYLFTWTEYCNESFENREIEIQNTSLCCKCLIWRSWKVTRTRGTMNVPLLNDFIFLGSEINLIWHSREIINPNDSCENDYHFIMKHILNIWQTAPQRQCNVFFYVITIFSSWNIKQVEKTHIEGELGNFMWSSTSQFPKKKHKNVVSYNDFNMSPTEWISNIDGNISKGWFCALVLHCVSIFER